MEMFARTLVKSCCIHPLAPAGEACSSVDLPLKSERNERSNLGTSDTSRRVNACLCSSFF